MDFNVVLVLLGSLLFSIKTLVFRVILFIGSLSSLMYVSSERRVFIFIL